MGNFSNYWDLTTLFTKLKNKLKSISDKIDDSVSLKTATGNPITLTDAANANAEELLMTIEPIQSGSGDPSPTNVRPISGLTEGKVVACEKNLLDLSSKTTATTLGITFTVNKNDDGAVTSINVNGTSTGTVDFTCPITTLKVGAQYTLNGGVAGRMGDYKLQVIYGDNNADAATSMGEDVNFTVLPDVPYRMRIRVYSGKTVNNLTFYPMIRLSTITDPTFEPYTAANATITLGQTVYGGSVNFKTGEVTVTHGIADLGTLVWDSWSTYGFRTYGLNNVIKITDNLTPINAISSEAIILSWAQYAANTDNTLKFALYKDANATFIIGGKDMGYADATAFKTAMSGVQLCYELATPTTLTLTPAELELLKGNNTITANGAEISLSYYPDNAIGVLAGRADDKADKEDMDAEIGDLSQTGLTGDSVAAQLNNAKGQLDRFKYNMISPTPLNSYTNNGARTIYQSVMAYINDLSASSRPRGFVQFMITYRANTLPSDLPSSNTKWYYAWGEIYFRNIDYVDATIILHPYGSTDGMFIKQVMNSTEGAWQAVLTDKSLATKYLHYISIQRYNESDNFPTYDVLIPIVNNTAATMTKTEILAYLDEHGHIKPLHGMYIYRTNGNITSAEPVVDFVYSYYEGSEDKQLIFYRFEHDEHTLTTDAPNLRIEDRFVVQIMQNA